MKVKELKRLLSYFSDELTVCVKDHSIGSLVPIEDVDGKAEKETGTFYVNIHIQGGEVK